MFRSPRCPSPTYAHRRVTGDWKFHVSGGSICGIRLMKGEVESVADEQDGVASPDEVRAALEGMTAIQLARLKVAAAHFARCMPEAPSDGGDELLQQAWMALLEGERRWKPAAVDIVGVVVGIMRSKASHARDAHARATAKGLAPAHDHEVAGLSSGEPDVRRRLIAVEDLAAWERAFSDKVEVLMVIQGYRDRMTTQEICSETGMTLHEYKAARKQLLRHDLRPSTKGTRRG